MLNFEDGGLIKSCFITKDEHEACQDQNQPKYFFVFFFLDCSQIFYRKSPDPLNPSEFACGIILQQSTPPFQQLCDNMGASLPRVLNQFENDQLASIKVFKF
jgi:hypothetical protein